MFIDLGAIYMGIKLANFERERWDKLTPDQKMMELRMREVRAQERLADLSEERNKIERRKWF